MSTSAKVVNLEVHSDTVCPFCYVGYRRINQAIRELEAEGLPATFSVRFSPFQLDPTLPVSPGENKRERYERRFGGKEKVEAMIDAMVERGRACEPPIEFSYGGNVSNTTASHRLLEKAYETQGQEGQTKMVQALFTLYFEREGDIGSFDSLSSAAAEAGVLSKEDALTFLESEEMKEEVNKGITKSQMRGISGVPYTIVNGQFGISGAQETETFKEVFRKVAKGELKA
ncbi:hypothetical protein JCM11641_007962 [Rhodosporidiobolus odoratus]